MARPKEKEIKKIMSKKQLNKKIRNLKKIIKYYTNYITFIIYTTAKQLKKQQNWKILVYQQLING